MHRSFRASWIPWIAFGFVAALAGKASPATFTNSAPIVIPAPGSSNGTQIAVSGIGNVIVPTSGVIVTLTDFTDTHPADVGLVLVGPTGAALVLMGDCGGSTAITIPLTLAFDDAAAPRLPQTALNTSGTFKPTQYASIGSFPSPGPGLAYNTPPVFGTATLASTFQGTNPNGTWSLYAMDPTSGDTGQIANGWSLQITATPEPAGLSLAAIASVALLRRRCGPRRLVMARVA